LLDLRPYKFSQEEKSNKYIISKQGVDVYEVFLRLRTQNQSLT